MGEQLWGNRRRFGLWRVFMGRLTAKLVGSVASAGRYEDGDGLRLVVKTSGRKSWVLRYQLNGKRREAGLGSFPAVGLKDARIAAGALRGKIHAGTDPLDER